MTKAIIFDLGGVLFINGTKKFINTLSTRYNIDSEKVKSVMDGGVGSLYREAKISRDEFWAQAIQELGIEGNIDLLEEEWINGYILMEETRDLIIKLRKKYKIYFVSDNAKELSEQLNKKTNFRNWFNGGVLANEAGVRKPHPKIYEMVLQKAEVSPNEALYIDDKEDNLFPPQKLGMQTILFETPQKLSEKLLQLGIL
jgi:HAD superfamily hydrolase (TIGR01509 family)